MTSKNQYNLHNLQEVEKYFTLLRTKKNQIKKETR